MKRTFSGFLEAYCRELSGLETSSLRKLSQAALRNARLVEPLFAFAVLRGKGDYLLKLSEGAWFHDDYVKLKRALEEAGSLEDLLESSDAPARYSAVLDAFLAQGDELAAARRINALLRPRIVDALAKSGITRYRLCQDLKLNPGNVYAYLAGDDAKISKATAQRILRYAESR